MPVEKEEETNEDDDNGEERMRIERRLTGISRNVVDPQVSHISQYYKTHPDYTSMARTACPIAFHRGR